MSARIFHFPCSNEPTLTTKVTRLTDLITIFLVIFADTTWYLVFFIYMYVYIGPLIVWFVCCSYNLTLLNTRPHFSHPECDVVLAKCSSSEKWVTHHKFILFYSVELCFMHTIVPPIFKFPYPGFLSIFNCQSELLFWNSGFISVIVCITVRSQSRSRHIMNLVSILFHGSFPWSAAQWGNKCFFDLGNRVMRSPQRRIDKLHTFFLFAAHYFRSWFR